MSPNFGDVIEVISLSGGDFFFGGTKVAIVIIITNECGEKDKDRFCRLESLFQEVGIMTKAKDVIMKI